MSSKKQKYWLKKRIKKKVLKDLRDAKVSAEVELNRPLRISLSLFICKNEGYKVYLNEWVSERKKEIVSSNSRLRWIENDIQS